jgi:hypothetical protein
MRGYQEDDRWDKAERLDAWKSVFWLYFPALGLLGLYFWTGDLTVQQAIGTYAVWGIVSAVYKYRSALLHVAIRVLKVIGLLILGVIAIVLFIAHPVLGTVWCALLVAAAFAYRHLLLAKERNELLRYQILRDQK